MEQQGRDFSDTAMPWPQAVGETHLSTGKIDLRGRLWLDPLKLSGKHLQLAQVRALHLLRIPDAFHHEGG
jgi:hypothetical protein